MMSEYYLQDSRGYVGNDVLWWAENGQGYTTDLTKAQVFSKDEAVRHNQDRHTDVPWPKDYIDNKSRPTVDIQRIALDLALRGTGIKLNKPKPPKKVVARCVGCGRFMSEHARWELCKNCGTDNRP